MLICTDIFSWEEFIYKKNTRHQEGAHIHTSLPVCLQEALLPGPWVLSKTETEHTLPATHSDWKAKIFLLLKKKKLLHYIKIFFGYAEQYTGS